MPTTLAQLAQLVGGEVRGEASLVIAGASPLHEARAGYITLITSESSLAKLAQSPAVAAVTTAELSPPIPHVVVANPMEAFARIFSHFRPARSAGSRGISPAAHVSQTARLGEDVAIHAGAVIGDEVEIGPRTTIHGGVQVLAGSRIGADCTLFPNVTLYEETVLGNRVLVHSAAVLGAYGFGYEMAAGRHVRGPQLGWVEIEDDVEIGAGTTIDRGVFGATRVGEGTKIDNQVMIAHNCRIGRHNILCSQVGMAGSVTTGDYVVLAGQVGVRDHVTIGDRVVVGAKSGVMADLPAGGRFVGAPVNGEREQMMIFSVLPRLPEMRKQLRELQRQVDGLRREIENAERKDAA